MRALHPTAAFLLATLGWSCRALAHVPLFTPHISLSLALDWNKLAHEAIARPASTPVAPARRHQVGKLTVTTAAPPSRQADTVVAARVEIWARSVLVPSYVKPEVERTVLFRQLYVTPYAPYLGAFGANFTVETDALLR